MLKAVYRKVGKKLAPAWKKFRLYFFDICSFLGTLAFAAYISILIFFDFGYELLNYTLFAVSLLFALLYLIKIAYYNRKAQNSEATKNLRAKFRLTKYLLKVFMFVVIIVGLISIFKSGSFVKNVTAAVATLVSNLIFFALLWWDTHRMLRARYKAKYTETKYSKKNWE